MSMVKKLVLLTSLFSTSVAFSSAVCNINGDWYSTSGDMALWHFTQADNGEVNGTLDGTANTCMLSRASGTVSEDGMVSLLFVAQKNNQCTDVSLGVAAKFEPNCMSLTGSWTSNDHQQGTFTMQRVPVKIYEPGNDKDLVITAEPRMPDVTFKAKLLSQLKVNEGIFPYIWTITFKDNLPNKQVFTARLLSDFYSFEGLISPRFTDLIDMHDPQNPRAMYGDVMGGKMLVSLSLHENLHDEKTYQLKGTNPGQAEIEKVIADPITRQIACQESRYKHFEALREGGVGLPTVSACGVGIMQLCYPKATPEQAWNWRENIKGGIELYKSKRSMAFYWPYDEQSYVNEKRKEKGLPLCKELPPLTEEQLERDTIRLFNCGHEYQWEPWDDPDCQGQWVSDPTCKIDHPDSYDPDYVKNVLTCDVDH